MERDSWSGPSSDGYSLHLTEELHRAYMKAFSDRQKADYAKNRRVPESYDSPDGEAYLANVDEATFEAVKTAGAKGVRSFSKDYPKPIRTR